MIKNIQSLRGIAVLFVVFFHLYIVEKKYSGFDTLLPDFLQFGMFGVDLFFVISGFVMVTITRGKFQTPRQSFIFLYHRAARIYPLYWVYTILALIVFLLQPAWVNSSQGNQVNILASFLLLPSDKLPLVQVGWTLIHEIYFYLVYFLIFLFLPERFLIYAIMGWGASVILLNLSAASNNPFYHLAFHPLTIEFLGGCLLAMIYHKHEKSKVGGGSQLAWIAVAALLVSVAGHVQVHAISGVPPAGWWRVLLYGLPSLIIVYCLTNAERGGFVFHSSIFQVGNASYSIYLSHLFTINVVGRIWKMFSVERLFDNLIAISTALILVLLVGFMSYRLVETPLLKLSRKIT